ncbi:unnamed protein product [Trichobilharzia regenti]|nr:unnamed protein product [Trichobilharzia regenti]
MEKLQFAFLQRDGCFEATNLLHTTLREAHSNYTSCSIAILNISKAFDSVLHQRVLRVAVSFGAPPMLREYLTNYYSNSYSLFHEVKCHPTRGVKQGDPPSPLLFIMTMDEILNVLEAYDPIYVDGYPLHYIAYAGDLNILAPNAVALQNKLICIAASQELAGLLINVNLSHTINIVADRERKIMALSPTIFDINCQSNPAISPTEEFTHLGVRFNNKDRHCFDHVSVLNGYLDNVKRAPLRPHQRIKILKNNLIPRLLYSLTLSITHKNTLKTMDKLIRATVRRWPHLSKDTLTAFFHADIKKGGLEVMNLSTTIPSHRRKRIEALLNKRNPLIRSIASSATFRPFLRICNLPIQAHRQMVTSAEEAHESWAKQLHSSADGYGLTESTTCPESHKWLLNPEMVLPKLYVRAVQLRGGLLGTKTRNARGRPGVDINCRGGCGQPENPQHILQHCALTHEVRCKRYNDVLKLIAKKLRKSNTRFYIEPRVPTPTSFCKPDMIIPLDGVAYILDVTV